MCVGLTLELGVGSCSVTSEMVGKSQGSLDSDEKEMIGMEREQNKVLLFVLTLQEEHNWL